MNFTRRYIPLSTVLLLAATVGSAHAGSALDPYFQVSPPQPKEKKKAPPKPITATEEITQPSTYVSMPMGNQSAKTTASAKSSNSGEDSGIFGSVTKKFKNVGDLIGDSAKASGDAFKKGASTIGQGLKSTSDKIVDGTQSVGEKVAKSAPKAKDPQNKVAAKESSPERTAAIEDLYVARTKNALAAVDKEASNKKIKKDFNYEPGKRESFMSLDNGDDKKKGIPLFKGIKNPIAKGRSSSPNSPLDAPPSGFLDGALAGEDEKLLSTTEEKQKLAKEKLANNSAKTASGELKTSDDEKKEKKLFARFKKPQGNSLESPRQDQSKQEKIAKRPEKENSSEKSRKVAVSNPLKNGLKKFKKQSSDSTENQASSSSIIASSKKQADKSPSQETIEQKNLSKGSQLDIVSQKATDWSGNNLNPSVNSPDLQLRGAVPVAKASEDLAPAPNLESSPDKNSLEKSSPASTAKSVAMTSTPASKKKGQKTDSKLASFKSTFGKGVSKLNFRKNNPASADSGQMTASKSQPKPL